MQVTRDMIKIMLEDGFHKDITIFQKSIIAVIIFLVRLALLHPSLIVFVCGSFSICFALRAVIRGKNYLNLSISYANNVSRSILMVKLNSKRLINTFVSKT